jgi:diguanylate cyclase (GGDEF)-like protein
MGGEEFILILPETTRELAFRRADAIRGEIKLLQLVSGAKALGVVTISAGIAAFQEDGDICELFLRVLFLAKGNGRDRVELYLPGAGLEIWKRAGSRMQRNRCDGSLGAYRLG